MKYPNPTPVNIGMEASFAGKHYRVVGRAVLGVVDDGELYYWNEFYLEPDSGDTATLVYEDNEDGPSWKMFTMFEPQFAISAEDAAAKRSGDLINLDGINCRVTQVDHSRIYYTEGKTPEGEVEGAKADYFNAVEAGRMIVVSWTGSEVECYHGMTVTSGMVASAFNLERSALPLETGPDSRFSGSSRTDSSQGRLLIAVLGVMAIVLVLFALKFDTFATRRSPAVRKFAAPTTTLSADFVTLNGVKYQSAKHTVVEVAEMGERSQWHEYFLKAEDGSEALLIHGMQPGTQDWVLFTPLSPAESLTPQQAAKITVGQIVNVDGVVAAVTELFRSTVLRDDATGTSSTAGEVRYGFLGKQNTRLLLVRWNQNDITFRKGTALSEREIKDALDKPPGK